MANTYSYNILNIEVTPSFNGMTDIVCNVDFEYIANNGNGVTAKVVRRKPFWEADPANFTPYSSITKQQIIEWIEASTDMNALKKIVDYELSVAERPEPVEKALPF